MFKNDYQGGPYFEIFSAQGKDALANWKLMGSSGIRKVYEKEVKGYVYSLEGATSTTKMTLPKDSRHGLVLVQHYLIFQIYISRGQDFCIELGVVDISCNKRRILLSTSQREVQSTPLHAKVPLHIIKRGTWLNLCIDLVSLVGDLWRGQTFKAVENVCVAATCQLRKIFSMKRPPLETADENDINQNCQLSEFDHIPKQCQFANEVQHETQMINLKKILRSDKFQSNDDISSRGSPFPTSQSVPHMEFDQKPKSQIAFGSKVPVVAPRKSSHKRHSAEAHGQLTSRRTNGTASTSPEKNIISSRHSIPSEFTVCHPPPTPASHPPNSAVGTKHLEHDMSFKPHPPREPSSEKNRRRIRVKSAGHELNAESVNCKTSHNLANNEESSRVSVAGRSQPNDGGQTNREIYRFKTNKSKSDNNIRSSGFMDAGVGPDVPEIQSPRKPIEMDESLCGVIAMLKDGLVAVDSKLSDKSSSSNGCQSEYEDSDPESYDQKDPVYVFTSFPKSAPECSHSPIQEADSANGKSKVIIADPIHSVRGAKPEDDFVSVMNGSDEDSDCNEAVPATNSRCARTHSNSATSSRGSSGKSVSSRTNILLLEKGSRLPVHSQQQQLQSKSNISHKSENPIPYDSRQYTPFTDNTNGHQSSISRLNRKSLREVSPSNIRKSLVRSSAEQKPYDSTKYQTADDDIMMDSLEERMLASMKRQQDEELALHQKKSGGLPVEPQLLANHLYDDSLTTNSDDDTTFNSLKVPLALRFAHNYKEEMKYPCRRSTDTLSSSNPRDWSNVFSPPIVLASEIDQEPLQGTLNGCPDDNLTKDCVVQPQISLNEKDHEEELQLLYDPVLGYYYDPKSKKYYQLI